MNIKKITIGLWIFALLSVNAASADYYQEGKTYLKWEVVQYKVPWTWQYNYVAKYDTNWTPWTDFAWDVIVPVGNWYKWIPGMIYNSWDLVEFAWNYYKAKWWTKSQPATDDTWSKVNTSKEYSSELTYLAGDEVTFEWNTYVAKWWTNTRPWVDNSWEIK